MKKGMVMWAMTVFFSAASAMTALAAWEQEGDQWRYYNEQGDMLRSTWVGNYYIGADGVMQTNTLTSDGYWLDESGLASEEKRIYGQCVFAPTSYQVVGDKIMIWGDIGDSGYASQEYIDSLEVGDTIAVPGESKGFWRMWRFNETDQVTDVEISDGRKKVRVAESNGDFGDWDFYEAGHLLSSDSMIGYETGSMEGPVYRLVQEEVLLVADKKTKFLKEVEFEEFRPDNIMETLDQQCGQFGGVWDVNVTDGHIEQAIDVLYNYVG